MSADRSKSCKWHGGALDRAPECPGCNASKGRDATIQPDEPWPRAIATQVGGDHYSKMAIQPMEYSMKNGLDACQHTAIKYISRFRDKGGIEDLRKAKHVIDMLIQFEEEKAK